MGLPDSARRRTPGLRRQDVAQLAGISIDYYIRLEQGRGSNPSRQVLSALSRALLLTADEREYLFRVAGENPPAVCGPTRELPPAIEYVLAGMPEVPAYVVDAKYDVLAWNHLATYFLGDLTSVPEHGRNMARWMFGHPADDPNWHDEASVEFARSTVADLRAAYARYPGDAGIEGLVTELLGLSERFAEMWAAHDVVVRRKIIKKLHSPTNGWMECECQVLQISETGQRIIIYYAEPGSPAREMFRDLAAAQSTA